MFNDWYTHQLSLFGTEEAPANVVQLFEEDSLSSYLAKVRADMSENHIELYFQCGMCAQEQGDHDPQLSVGWTVLGIQVWCRVHDVNVCHIDFEGKKHPASLSRKVEK